MAVGLVAISNDDFLPSNPTRVRVICYLKKIGKVVKID